MQPNSILSVDLQSPETSTTPALAVNDLLELNGTLQVSLDGFTPVLGDTFPVLSFGFIAGQFSTLDLPALPQGLAWNISQLTSSGVMEVTTVPEPMAFAMTSLGCAILGRRRIRKLI